MKIVVAPDSFKGSLTAVEIIRIVSGAAERVFGDITVVPAPIADGGEGTVDAFVLATGGAYRQAIVTGPMGTPVTARYGLLPGGSAALEMAQASGLPLISVEERNPLKATSRGTGELLLHALGEGARDILMGIGGSATNDGGTGLLTALGARFTDAAGNPVPEGGEGLEHIVAADFSGLDPRLSQARIRVLCDVTNPLLGERGATRVYGPQKGADAQMLDRLERGMANYARVLAHALGHSVADMPGAGAAGGIGAALGGVLGAEMSRGVESVLDAIKFDELLHGADLVITAEGRMDAQSMAYGKAPIGVAHRCRRLGVPVIAMVGGMTDEAMAFCGGNASVMTTVNGPMTVEDAIAGAERLLNSAAERMFRMVRIGRVMGGIDESLGANG